MNQPMKPVHVATRRALPRRSFLQGLGVGLGLPLLEAMNPAFARGVASDKPRRMLAICNNLGLLGEHFFPGDPGRGYTASAYLEHLREFRDDFTVFSGVQHPDVDAGHPADNCFLTAAPHPGNANFRNTISLDQFLAERLGHLTRFPSMTLGVNVKRGQRSLSWTGGGVLIPCEEKPSEVYRRLFLQGAPGEVERQIRQLEQGRSIMDAVASQANRLQRSLGERDRERLDQYLTGVRDLEKRLAAAREWERVPKPEAPVPAPIDPDDPREYMEKVRLMYDMARLAFESDSTRFVTLLLDSVNSPAIDVDGVDISDGYHNLSHHSKEAGKLAQLKAIDEWHMRLLADLFGKLRSVREDQETLLDRSMILYGSNLGDADKHTTDNLPVLLAGGGFKHGQHLAFDRVDNEPLPNLFVSMIRRLGLDVDRFATSSGPMRGLDAA